jgi:coproporphyrinogen III oxidase-like Fe-S oxidoreductase
LEKIAELLAAQGLNKELKFGVFGRTDLINEKVLSTLVKMNVRSISFGLESGSDRILHYLKKPTVTVKNHLEALQLCKKHGIHTNGTFIVGSPDETEEDLAQTMELIKNPNLDQVSISQLTPLPGSDLWRYALGRNVVSEDPCFPFELEGASHTIRAQKFLCNRISMEKLQEWMDRISEVAKNKSRSLNFSHLRLRQLQYVFSGHFLSKLFKNLQEAILYLRNARFKTRSS